MGGMPDIMKILERIRDSHIPLPVPHRVVLNPNLLTSDCDLKTRIVRLNPNDEFLEWSYRHEIEHLGKYPRREKEMFKHFVQTIKLFHLPNDRELFKRYFKEIANITYDCYIDYELCQRYDKVKDEIKRYLKTLPKNFTKEHPLEECRSLAIKGKKPNWLTKNIPRTMVYIFEKLKPYLEKGIIPKVLIHITPKGDVREIAEGMVELIDEGYGQYYVYNVAQEYLGEVANVSVSKEELKEEFINALIRSRVFSLIVFPKALTYLRKSKALLKCTYIASGKRV